MGTPCTLRCAPLTVALQCTHFLLHDTVISPPTPTSSPLLALVKIDVEGDELAVLQGLADADWALVKQVVMEAHDVDGRVDAIRSLLARHGFEVRVGGGDPRMERNGCFGIAARRICSPSTISRRQRGGHVVSTCSELN
jgi:hypothetical protein